MNVQCVPVVDDPVCVGLVGEGGRELTEGHHTLTERGPLAYPQLARVFCDLLQARGDHHREAGLVGQGALP